MQAPNFYDGKTSKGFVDKSESVYKPDERWAQLRRQGERQKQQQPGVDEGKKFEEAQSQLDKRHKLKKNEERPSLFALQSQQKASSGQRRAQRDLSVESHLQTVEEPSTEDQTEQGGLEEGEVEQAGVEKDNLEEIGAKEGGIEEGAGQTKGLKEKTFKGSSSQQIAFREDRLQEEGESEQPSRAFQKTTISHSQEELLASGYLGSEAKLAKKDGSSPSSLLQPKETEQLAAFHGTLKGEESGKKQKNDPLEKQSFIPAQKSSSEGEEPQPLQTDRSKSRNRAVSAAHIETLSKEKKEGDHLIQSAADQKSLKGSEPLAFEEPIDLNSEASLESSQNLSSDTNREVATKAKISTTSQPFNASSETEVTGGVKGENLVAASAAFLAGQPKETPIKGRFNQKLQQTGPLKEEAIVSLEEEPNSTTPRLKPIPLQSKTDVMESSELSFTTKDASEQLGKKADLSLSEQLLAEAYQKSALEKNQIKKPSSEAMQASAFTLASRQERGEVGYRLQAWQEDGPEIEVPTRLDVKKGQVEGEAAASLADKKNQHSDSSQQEDLAGQSTKAKAAFGLSVDSRNDQEVSLKTQARQKGAALSAKEQEKIEVGAPSSKGHNEELQPDGEAAKAIVTPIQVVAAEQGSTLLTASIEKPRPAPNLSPTMRELIAQLAKELEVLHDKGVTETTIILKGPPLFSGVKVSILSYETAPNQLNIQFTNLTGPGKAILDANLPSLQAALEVKEKGFTIHQIITSTLEEPNRFVANAPNPQRDQEGREEGQSGQSNQQGGQEDEARKRRKG